MSRLKKFTHSLASGYMQIGVNMLYTLASIPLALHYLSAKEFALWQIAVTVAGYLLLIDFGLTDSMTRILMDHKDDPAGGAYGSVIKIGFVVCSIQGLLITAAGIAVSFWMPQLVNLHAQFSSPGEVSAATRALFFLTAGQCLLQGFFFPARVFWNLAVAHQRYDLYNYTQIGSMILGFAALWISFQEGAGIYSVLVAGATSLSFGFCCSWVIAVRHGFLPPRGYWGKFDPGRFREIFLYGGNLFLMSLGSQLINASQILVISHSLGLEAAAVWAVATKPFMAAQQLVGRIVFFACSPLCEMVVRGENERFLRRFRDLVIVSVSSAVFVAGSIALCNRSFLEVWLKGRPILSAIHALWSPWNDALFALWFVTVCSTAIHVMAVGFNKQIGRMRYVYFCEGLIFVTASIFLARPLGVSGIILAAIAANILCSGVFGLYRTAVCYRISAYELLVGWMGTAAAYLVLFAPILIACRFLTAPLPLLLRLATDAAVAAVIGLWLLWRVGLTPELRKELRSIAGRGKTYLPKFFH